MAGPQAQRLVAAIAAEIMAYLTLNPTAGDTAKGIWQWWLKATSQQASVEAVEVALEQLVKCGVIGTRLLTSGEGFYFGLGNESTNHSESIDQGKPM